MELWLLKRRKLPLLFLFGVGIPSLALAVLALRGIQNELAVLEQRRLDAYRTLARRISDTLVAEMVRSEADLSRATAGLGATPSPALRRELDDFPAGRPIVEGVFFVGSSGDVHLAAGDLLFRAPTDLPPPESPPWPAAAAEAFRAGQRDEFQEARYEAALSSYRRAFRSAAHPTLEGEVLLAITRVQRKAGRLAGAMSDCETLLDEYGSTRTSGGTPIGPVAHLERGSLLLAAGDSAAALATLVDLYGRLVEAEWELEKPEYSFLAVRSASAIRKLMSVLEDAPRDSLSRTFSALEARESTGRRRAERLLLLREVAERQLPTLMGKEPERQTGSPQRLALEGGGETFLVSLVGRPGSDVARWGLLLDERYTESLVGRALEAGIDARTASWLVRDRDGDVIASGADPPGGPPMLNATLAGSFPPWLVEFHARPQNPWRLLLAPSQSIYLYMLLAIATILAFGLALTVRAVNRELELARLKSDFVSTVSHEFKSPLTSILQLSEMLQTGRVASEERRQWYYDVLVEQSARLSALVTNVLDLARLDERRKELRSDPVDLGELVDELVTTARHRVAHEGFELECQIQESLPPVRGDAEALRQAISNLLDNAVLYSGDARRIAVGVRADREVVTVEVEDRGVGIPPEELDEVFDRFFRGSGELVLAVRGSGLGLTLVKEIVDAHGGSVNVSSEVGEGSTFRITLPAIKEAAGG